MNCKCMTNYFNPIDCGESICTSEQRKKYCKKMNKMNIDALNNQFLNRRMDIKIEKICNRDGKCELVTAPAFKTLAPALSQKVVTIISEYCNVYK